MPLRLLNKSNEDEMEKNTQLFIDSYNNQKYEGIVDLGKKVMVESNPRYKEVMAIMRDMSLGHRFTKNIKAIYHAIDYANELNELGYDVNNNYKALAKGYYKLNKYDEMYEASLNIEDEEERLYYEIIYKSAKGKYEEAIELANGFLSTCNDDRIITILLTYINNYIRLYDEETAKYIYDKLVEVEPNLRNSKLDSYFGYFFSKNDAMLENKYIMRQFMGYDSQDTLNHLYKKSEKNPDLDMFNSKSKVQKYLLKAQGIINDKEPDRLLLVDQYMYHEDKLKDKDYPTDEMVIHTLPNTKKIISAHPLGVSQDIGKVKRGK